MNPIIIACIIIFLLILVAMFVWKKTSENKAKKNYKPPIANEKIVLPEMKDEQLPARSGKNLRFCPACGTANSDQAACCIKCGTKL